jgi:hypothetical protein
MASSGSDRRFLGELIELENRLSRGYGDGQPARRKNGRPARQ